MFAASRGISSRIVGAGRRSKDGVNGLGHRKRKRKKIPLKQRLYLPFMWSTCLGTFLGFIVLCGGTAMCVVGYYAEYFATTETITNSTNGTDITITKDSSMHFHIKNLTFVGPIFMGIGAFIIVVACVVVFETRDKVLELMEEQQRTAAKRKPDFYDLIVAQMKKKEEEVLRGGQDNFAFNENDEYLGSGKFLCTGKGKTKKSKSLTSSSGAIEKALKNIGTNIFTIDVSRENTLTPIAVHRHESKITENSLAPLMIKPRPYTLAAYGKHTEKYPSVTCIHDMMKANDLSAQNQHNHSWFDDSHLSLKTNRKNIYEIVPIDIDISSSPSRRPTPQKKVTNSKVHTTQIECYDSPEDNYCGQKGAVENSLGFSSEDEYFDNMSTRDTCVSLGIQDKGLPTKEALYDSTDTSDIPPSKGQTVVVMVHQAPMFRCQSDLKTPLSTSLSTSASSCATPNYNEEKINDILNTEAVNKNRSEKCGHNSLAHYEQKYTDTDEVHDSCADDPLHLTDEYMKHLEAIKKQNKQKKNAISKDDGNSSDSSSNA